MEIVFNQFKRFEVTIEFLVAFALYAILLPLLHYNGMVNKLMIDLFMFVYSIGVFDSYLHNLIKSTFIHLSFIVMTIFLFFVVYFLSKVIGDWIIVFLSAYYILFMVNLPVYLKRIKETTPDKVFELTAKLFLLMLYYTDVDKSFKYLIRSFGGYIVWFVIVTILTIIMMQIVKTVHPALYFPLNAIIYVISVYIIFGIAEYACKDTLKEEVEDG